MFGRGSGGQSERTVTGDAEQIATWASPMVNALNSARCNSDPACRTSRSWRRRPGAGRRPVCVHRALAVTLQCGAVNTRHFAWTVKAAGRATEASRQHPKAVDGLPSKLAQMQQGANAFADGSAALAAGVQELADRVKRWAQAQRAAGLVGSWDADKLSRGF